MNKDLAQSINFSLLATSSILFIKILAMIFSADAYVQSLINLNDKVPSLGFFKNCSQKFEYFRNLSSTPNLYLKWLTIATIVMIIFLVFIFFVILLKLEDEHVIPTELLKFLWVMISVFAAIAILNAFRNFSAPTFVKLLTSNTFFLLLLIELWIIGYIKIYDPKKK